MKKKETCPYPLSYLWYAVIFCALPIGLVACGTFVPWYLITVSLPKYQNYLDEERHHVNVLCENITRSYAGKVLMFNFNFLMHFRLNLYLKAYGIP